MRQVTESLQSRFEKVDKYLMAKLVLMGTRNPETPSSGMDPRMPVAVILADLVAMLLITLYWEYVLELPIDSWLVYTVVSLGLIPTLYLLIGMFLNKSDKEEIRGEIQTMGTEIRGEIQTMGTEIRGEIQTMEKTLLRIEILLGGDPVQDQPDGSPADLRR